jgi:cobalt-zinc-cadmium efflux system protein
LSGSLSLGYAAGTATVLPVPWDDAQTRLVGPYARTLHAHDHDHGHSRLATDRRALAIALALILGLMAVEVAAGIVAGSLALLADAGHMLTDAAALGVALFAAAWAGRPARGRWTFGYRRLEILAAQVNGITLLLVVALVGVVVNLVATGVLARASRESLNVRGAFVHVATDLAAFAATAVAGALILITGWNRFDPVASLLVAALMVWSSVGLLRESASIFLERSPEGIDPDAVGRALIAEPDVVEVHDLHVWTVTSGFPALAAHVLVSREADCHAVRRSLERMLHDQFGLEHTTLQVDHAGPRLLTIERR